MFLKRKLDFLIRMLKSITAKAAKISDNRKKTTINIKLQKLVSEKKIYIKLCIRRKKPIKAQIQKE